MTICIAGGAAMGDDEKCIILCTDWLVSGPIGSSDVMLKQRYLPNDFHCLISGEDGYMLEMKRILWQKMSALKKDSFHEDHVLVAVKDTLFERKKELVEDYVKSRFAMNYQTFYDTAAKNMPPELYRDAMFNIRQINLKTDFIVAGFSSDMGVIIEANGEGEASLKEDFATVGSGSYLAMASLLNRQYTDIWPVSKCLYAIFEAKKYAEHIKTVGQRTNITLIYPKGNSRTVTRSGFAALEKQFKKFGPQIIASNLKIEEEHLKDD